MDGDRDGGSGVVTDVCRVGALHEDRGPVGVTAIDKRPTAERVPVGRLGLRGDVQADREHHGGADKAVYVLDADEARWWAAELGEDVPPGRFGENLRIAGLAVDDAEIGERWLVGPTLELEVTGPRSPCAKFGRWLGREGWVRRYTDRGRPGVYLRVVAPGDVGAGDPVRVARRPGHGVTVAGWFGGRRAADARALLAHESAGWRLADYLREHVVAAAARRAD